MLLIILVCHTIHLFFQLSNMYQHIVHLSYPLLFLLQLPLQQNQRIPQLTNLNIFLLPRLVQGEFQISYRSIQLLNCYFILT